MFISKGVADDRQQGVADVRQQGVADDHQHKTSKYKPVKDKPAK